MANTVPAVARSTVPAAFRGEWLEPGVPGYDEQRSRIYNTRFDPHPRLIARCLGNADVVVALAHARDHELGVTVRCAGLSLWDASAGDGDLVIDLSLMRGVRVDAHERTAWIQGGARGGDVQAEAELHGLGGVTGLLSDTGVGLMLSGGTTYLSRRVGYASDNVLAVELVTAAGEVVTASPEENAELFWAVRGTTGNFGVVTALKIALHEVPPLVLGGTLGWTGDNVRRALKAYEQASDWASDDFFLLGFLHPGGFDTWICHSGPAEVAEAEVQKLIDAVPPDLDERMRISFRDITFLHDAEFPPQRLVFCEETVTHLDDRLIDLALEALAEPLPPGSTGARDIEILCRARGFSRAPEHPNAIHDGEIPPCWSLACGAWFTDPAEDEVHKTWLDKLICDIGATGLTTGNLQPGYTGDWPDQDRVARIYGKNYERLRELKTTWDPDNVFRANVNIRPAAKA